MGKTNKLAAKVLTVFVMLPMVFAAGCGGDGGNGGGGGGSSGQGDKKLDNTKTQIQIWNYTAGYGDAWLSQHIEEFEKLHEETVYEEGKKGVQLWFSGDIKKFEANDIKEGSTDIYFLEGADYYPLKQSGALENLNSIVTQASAYDGKTVESKMSEQQQEYFGGDGNYFAVPHYKGNYGIIYNIELFDKRGYYISDYTDVDGYHLISSEHPHKSNGPDGKPNTSDDGLPATYDEFKFLFMEIKAKKDIPMYYPGMYWDYHLNALYSSLVAEYEGVEQMTLNLDYNGMATDLVVLEDNGQGGYQIAKEANGSIKTEEKEIKPANGYDVARQAGKYYAMDLINFIIENNENDRNLYASSYSHLMAQQAFVQAGTTFSSGKNIAMLCEGSWWEGQASSVFENMAKKNPEYSKKNRQFGWMPLPKAEGKEGSDNVFVDNMNALVCVKAGLSEGKKSAALDFVQYVCSDEALVQFTQISGALKAFNYTLTEDEQSGLSTFAKSVISYNETATPFSFSSNDSFFLKHRSDFLPESGANGASVGGSNYSYPPTAFRAKITPEAYFISAYEYWRSKDTTYWTV